MCVNQITFSSFARYGVTIQKRVDNLRYFLVKILRLRIFQVIALLRMQIAVKSLTVQSIVPVYTKFDIDSVGVIHRTFSVNFGHPLFACTNYRM